MAKKSWLHVFLIIVGLITLGIFSAVVGLRLMIKGEEVSVPNLEGQNIVTALEQLNSLNLRVEIEDQEFHQEVPGNHIISQRPAGGERVKTGRKIRLVLSKGAKLIRTPALTGNSWYQVQSILRKNGLVLGSVARVHSNDTSAQHIIAQSPATASPIKRGDKVNLLLSEGSLPDFYLMPDFIGKDLMTVRKQLKRMNLSLGGVNYEAYQGVEPGIVLNQLPAVGFRVKQGMLVDLVVSKDK